MKFNFTLMKFNFILITTLLKIFILVSYTIFGDKTREHFIVFLLIDTIYKGWLEKKFSTKRFSKSLDKLKTEFSKYNDVIEEHTSRLNQLGVHYIDKVAVLTEKILNQFNMIKLITEHCECIIRNQQKLNDKLDMIIKMLKEKKRSRRLIKY